MVTGRATRFTDFGPVSPTVPHILSGHIETVDNGTAVPTGKVVVVVQTATGTEYVNADVANGSFTPNVGTDWYAAGAHYVPGQGFGKSASEKLFASEVTIAGESGDDNIVVEVDPANPDSLLVTVKGTGGNDTFVFEDGAYLTGMIDGQEGTDGADYSDWTSEAPADWEKHPDVESLIDHNNLHGLPVLRREHGFHLAGSYYENAFGDHEKWSQDRLGRWFAIRPGGRQHERGQELKIITNRNEIRSRQNNARQHGGCLSEPRTAILNRLEMANVEANRTPLPYQAPPRKNQPSGTQVRLFRHPPRHQRQRPGLPS